MTYFSQRDQAWSDVKINGTSSDLGHYGCTITSLAVVFGKNPKDMETYLESLGAFVGDLVWWVKIPHFVSRFYCANVIAPVDEILNNIRSGKQVLLNVHFGAGNPLKPNHWVLLLDDQGTIFDPWYGDTIHIELRYGPMGKSILGGAYFDVPAAEWPKTLTSTAMVNRRAETNTGSAIYGQILKGTPVTVYAQVEGQSVNGNTIWYDTHDGYVTSEAFK